MAGIDDTASVIAGWATPPSPSPRTFFSSLLGEDISSRPLPDLLGENGIDGHLKQKTGSNSEDDGVGSGAPGYSLSQSGGMFSGQKSNSRGGLAERMAARAGFNAPRLNTARIRSSNMLPSSSSEVRSPYLTIPPGLSPTSLLESPVFIPNSMALSPTTGIFPIAQCINRRSMPISAAPDKDKNHILNDADSESFVFKHHVETTSSYFPSAANKVASVTSHQQSFPNIEVSVQSEVPAQRLESTEVLSQSQSQQELLSKMDLTQIGTGKDDTGNVTSDTKHSQLSDDREEGEGDQKELQSVAAAGALSEDGYNWRKYGQKQVKGSEYPRSYYKCTHPNCPVKKKVERSHEGHITEIIYKGVHNHPKPPPNRRMVIGSSCPPGEMDGTGQSGGHVGFDGGPSWAQHGAAAAGSSWRHDDMETASSASAATEFCDPSNSGLLQNGPNFETADAVDLSSTMSNNDDEDDQGTHGSVSLGYDEEGDESESKRRKLDAASVMEITGATRAIREPRVVVQTTSEVDILDDGYRWRKYGQKVVKGNPNPRSYYKCTSAGCTVRKHVERASHDLKSVITTYEGKHNHDVPAARSSSHISNGPSGMTSTPAGHANIPRSDPSKVRDSIARLPAPLNSFSLPSRQSLGPNPGFSFGINQPGLANLAMAGFGPGHGKLPIVPIRYFGQQQKVNEVMVMPKGEPKEEPISESAPSISNGSLYHQILSRLPLGHQL